MNSFVSTFISNIPIYCLLLSATMSVEAVNTILPQKSGTTGEVKLIPDKYFTTTYWTTRRKNNSQSISFAFPEQKSPSGGGCVEMTFQGERKSGGVGRVATCDFKGIPITPVYKTLEFWLKGGREDATIIIGATIGDHYYSWNVKLYGDQWRKVILPISRAYTRTGEKKSFNALKRLMFSTGGKKVTFQMSAFKLVSDARDLPLAPTKTLIIPMMSKIESRLDGVGDESFWGNALVIDEFKRNGTGDPVSETTVVRVVADKENLYLYAKMLDQDTSKMRAALKMRDQEIWQDDCLELLFDPAMDGKSYEHIIVNSLGTIQDYAKAYDQVKEMYLRSDDWNVDVRTAIKIDKEYWAMELVVPLAKLDIKPGAPFGFQIGRENHEIKEYSLVGVAGKFTEVLNFPVAVIGAPSIIVEDLNLGFKQPNEMMLRGKLSEAGSFELNVVVCNEDVNCGNQTVKKVVETDDNGDFVLHFKLNSPTESNYRVVVGGHKENRMIAPSGFNFYLSLPAEFEFGEIVLNPSPKELSWENGTFELSNEIPIVVSESASERTWTTARYLRETIFYDLFGLMPSIKNAKQVPIRSVTLLLKDELADYPQIKQSIGDGERKLKEEGYILKVTPENIIIVGDDAPGLYYGVVTLRQIVRGRCVKSHQPVVPCVVVIDWPDLRNRMLNVWKRSYRRQKEPYYDKERLATYIKEIVAGNKLNFFAYLFDNGLEFSREGKMINVNGFKSIKDFQDIARVCKDHFIEFVPAFQSGGHSGHITWAFPQLQESGFDKDQINVLHEDWKKIQFHCYQDILDALPDTKYFFIWHDEWWHHPRGEITKEFQGKPRWRVFADEVKKIHDFFSEREVRVMMTGDMIARDHNGGHPYDVYKAAEFLPKDIVIMNWGVGSAPDAAVEFTKMGFEVWDLFNQFKVVPPNDVKVIKGFGGIQYAPFYQTFWWSRDTILPDYTHAGFRSADYAWNIKHDALLTIGEWRRRYLNSVMSLYNFPKRRTGKLKKVEPCDLGTKANCSLDEWFGVPDKAPLISAEPNVAFTPFRIAQSNEKDRVVAVAKSESVKIPINSKAVVSLLFLQGTYVAGENRTALKKESGNFSYGLPVGEIQIEYSDGPTEIVPLLMGINTNEITPVWSGRFMYGSRYALDLKTQDGTPASLYLLEWVNPWPKRTIKNVVWKANDLDATPVLFGLTVAY